MFTDLMIDLETLGTSPTAPIIELTAIAFNSQPRLMSLEATANHIALFDDSQMQVGPYARPIEKNKDLANAAGFKASISYKSALEGSSMPDASTLKWWMEQYRQDPSVNPLGGDMFMSVALKELTHLIDTYTVGREVFVWCKGGSFDLAMLRHKYHYYFGEASLPWDFRRERCIRTLLQKEEDEAHKVDSPEYNRVLDIKRAYAGDFHKAKKPHDSASDTLAQIRTVIAAKTVKLW